MAYRIVQLEKDIQQLYDNDEVIAKYVNTGELPEDTTSSAEEVVEEPTTVEETTTEAVEETEAATEEAAEETE